LLAAGFSKAEIMPTHGHPVVFAEWLAAGPEAQTVLVYGHHDVQPPDPLEEWRTPVLAEYFHPSSRPGI
jgi:acetylornithine deacetylase/succinyl-diaminopimelate desuccinylase-like protein